MLPGTPEHRTLEHPGTPPKVPRICSHTAVTAQQNGQLLDFLNHYKQSYAKTGINLSLTVRTDMPKSPVRKGGVPSTTRRSSPKLHEVLLI